MPRLLNLLRRPQVTDVTPLESGPGLEVGVAGLACTRICVRRTERALGALPGVASVRFEPGPDRFLLRTEGSPPSRAQVAAALDSVVVAPWARRLLAAVAERLGFGKG